MLITEHHPLSPYIPHEARLLLLGSFPPAQHRWTMPFFYPNFQNDMWRILAHVFHGDPHYFLQKGDSKAFDLERIKATLEAQGIALYDVAQEVRRLKDNASDKFLEIITPTNLPQLLVSMPHCRAIASTGQKSAEEVAKQLHVSVPPMGESHSCGLKGFEHIRFYRMPSSSRAYPMRLEQKAQYYKHMIEQVLFTTNV